MKNILFVATFLFAVLNGFSKNISHSFFVHINIKNQSMEVIDKMMLPLDYIKNKETVTFSLSKKFDVSIINNAFVLKKLTNKKSEESNSKFIEYSVKLPENKTNDIVVPLLYTGVLKDEVEESAAEYARGFSETEGLISEDGIYLAGSTAWVPYFADSELFTYMLSVDIDAEWTILSQGKRIKNEVNNNTKTIIYICNYPMDEAYIVGGKWTEYSETSNKILVQAFLRSPDEKLAKKYLKVTEDYLNLYESLIGPYPYTKFALVENFWETGYGMPSFTLLGEKVIRFPWILHSSYPHELLHNYWGNSVFVDYEDGNWCEGITAYMADHLIKEQQGQGSDYRRSTLQKFSDYVNEENDFPIKEFRSRSNSAEEAIGYGKVLMMNEMLRNKFGDELFLKAYQDFYKNNKFRKASFDDIRKSFEKVTDTKLEAFFSQWINRKGAPSLKISNVKVSRNNSQYKLVFKLSQIQQEEPFSVSIPYVIYFEKENEIVQSKLKLDKRTQEFSFNFDNKPLRIEIDPQFNVFRRLDRSEVPTSLSKVFGAEEVLIIVPEKSELKDKYSEMAEMWKKSAEAQQKIANVVFDSELKKLPSDKTVWIFGFENKFSKEVKITQAYLNSLSTEDSKTFLELSQKETVVYAIPNSDNNEFSVGFVGTKRVDAIAGLIRKLPHYGKYSYLGFEGNKPSNVLKGSFPALNSIMFYTIEKNKTSQVVFPKLKERKALGQ